MVLMQRLLFCWVFLVCGVVVGHCDIQDVIRRLSRRGQGHQSHAGRHRHRHGRISPDSDLDYLSLSPRVAFSPTMPVAPPVELSIGDHVTPAGESRTEPSRRRQRRDVSPTLAAVLPMPVCQSQSNWQQRLQAEDMWGNNVDILQEIEIGGVPVNQYFFETSCQNERATCTGIDNSQYMSACKTKHIWAYAKVRRGSEVGWNLVKVPGSCNCALYRKPKGNNSSLAAILQAIQSR